MIVMVLIMVVFMFLIYKDFYDFCMKLKPMVADEDNYDDDDFSC